MHQKVNNRIRFPLFRVLTALACCAYPAVSMAQSHADVTGVSNVQAQTNISVSRDVPAEMPDGVRLMADLAHMHLMMNRPEFRGLWRSRCLENDGNFSEGWSVTFILGGEYCETPYQKDAMAALNYALRSLHKRE